MEIHLVLLLLLVCANASCKECDIIVIGAGASGLSAARKLSNDKTCNVIILEARTDRYGGRIWTNKETFPDAAGPEVDMGASYIHLPDPLTNSVVRLHTEFNLPTIEVNYSAAITVDEQSGRRYTDEEYDGFEGKVDKTFQTASALSQSYKTDVSMREALQRANLSYSISDPMSQLMVSIQEFWYGDSIDKLGAKNLYVSNDGWLESDFLPKLGYRAMLDRVVQNGRTNARLDILFGKEVTQVEVDAQDRVKVTCRDGSSYVGDAAIVTLPLGVLKADVVKFRPELPKRKRDAIQRLGFGVVNKLVLEFSRRFWPNNTFDLQVALTNTSDRGRFNYFSCFGAISDQPILMTFAISDFGLESESLSDDQLRDIALHHLRTILGSAMDGVTVVRMSRTRWLADPFARGSYSYPAVGTLAGDWERTGEAVPPLFFAGEHTQTRSFGTVHTAIDTGRRAADEVINYVTTLRNSNNGESIVFSSIAFMLNIYLSIYLNI